MNEKKENKIIIGLIILVVALSASWIGLRLYNTKIHNQLKDAQSELIAAQKKYKKSLAQAEKKYIANSATSKDNQVSSIGQHKNNYDILNSTCQTFFKTYMTFDNNSDYLARANKLAPIITNDLKNNKSLFDDGKDVTGHSMITAQKLTSTWNSNQVFVTNYNNQVINGIVNVNFSASSYGNPSNQAMRIYQVTYDKQQQKFTNIQLLQVSGQNTDLGN